MFLKPHFFGHILQFWRHNKMIQKNIQEMAEKEENLSTQFFGTGQRFSDIHLDAIQKICDTFLVLFSDPYPVCHF